MAFTPSPQYLQTVAQIESGGDPNAQNPNSSASGLFQFTDPVAAQYGLDDPTDPVAATDAMKSLTSDNYAALSKSLGRAPTEAELYLAHQQGAGGAAKLLSDPDAPAVDVLGKKQVLNNGGNPDMTAADFANLWQGKYDKAAGKIHNGVQVADSGQIASDATNFGAGDDVIAPATPAGFGAGDQTVAVQAVNHPHAVSDKFIPDTGKFRTAIDNFNQGTLMGWGGDATDALGALYAAFANDPAAAMKGEVNDPALAEQLINERQNNQANLKAGDAANPWTAGASNIGGLITGAVGMKGIGDALLPKAASAAIAKTAAANPFKTAALVGGSGQAVRDLGEAPQTGTGRFDNLGADVPIAALAGVGGASLAKGLSKVAGAVSDRFGQPIKDLINDWKSGAGGGGVLGDDAAAAATAGEGGAPFSAANPPPVTGVPNATPMQMHGILDDEDMAKLGQGRVLPMTAGQRTQDVGKQKMEEIALKQGSKPMAAALAAQQSAVAKPLQSVLGDNQQIDPLALNGRTQDEMTNAANILRNQYDQLGNKVNAAYTTARQGANGVAIDAGSIKNDFLGNVTNTLADENVQTGDIPKLDKNLQELQGILNPVDEEGNPSGNVTALKLEQLEAWKKRLNRTMSNTMEPADQRIVKMVGRHYDDFLTNLSDEAIVGGDSTAIDAFKNARSLASQKFKMYDSDTAVQRILDNREMSGSQLVNTILGANRMTGKGDDGRIVEAMLDHAGEQAPQMMDSMRKGVMSKVLGDSLSPTIDPSTVGTPAERNLIDFGKMKKSLGSLMSQRETFNTLFTPDEQSYFKQFYQDIGQIASKQSGAVNNSSTGDRVADLVSGIGKLVNNPLLKNVLGVGAVTSVVQEGLQKQAASIVTGRAEAGLNEFLANAFKASDAAPAYYGGYVGGQALDPIAQSMQGDNK